MKYIIILSDATHIYSKELKELFADKVIHLSKALGQFDEISIDARVYVRGRENGRSLFTFVAVECDDKEFQKMLEGVTATYNHLPAVMS